MLSPERFEYYTREKKTWESRGHSMSFTDLWGLIIEYFLNQEVREQEVTTFFPSQLPPHTSLLPYSYFTPGGEPSKSMLSKWFLPASEAQCHTHSLANKALPMPPGGLLLQLQVQPVRSRRFRAAEPHSV